MKYSVEIKQKAIEYYLVGYSAQKISTIIGVNEATIRKWLKENNINIRNGGSYNKIYKTKLLISPSTYEEVKGFVDTIKISDVQIRGKANKMDIYEVLKVSE